VAAQAEHVGHLLADQELGDQLSAFHAWHGGTRFGDRASS
jgi:hypothetical protein